MCYDGRPHDLINIYVANVGWNEEHVVKWCRECGSVCIARESDGRNFGYLGKMRFPKTLRELIDLKNQNKGGTKDV